MITLAFIGLVGGLITGVSPCVLPMLPIIFFAGTAGKTEGRAVPADGRVLVDEPTVKKARDFRPLKIIAGIVVSFSLFTLTGSVILSALGLPDDFLRWGGLVILTLVGLGLIFPRSVTGSRSPSTGCPRSTRTTAARSSSASVSAPCTSRAPGRSSLRSQSPVRPATSAGAPSYSRCRSPSVLPCRC